MDTDRDVRIDLGRESVGLGGGGEREKKLGQL